MTLAYQTGIFAQADLKKLPSLKSMLERKDSTSEADERADAQRRVNEMWGLA
jgi:hypothetical protein